MNLSKEAYEQLRENMRALWAALEVIREEVEQHGVGLLPSVEALDPDPMIEAEAIVRAIRKIADR